MSREQDFDPSLTVEERQALSLLAEDLERGRPVPAAGFRGNLQRHLLPTPGSSPSMSLAGSYRLWAAVCAGTGTLCLAVAAIGLAGTGPFAA